MYVYGIFLYGNTRVLVDDALHSHNTVNCSTYLHRGLYISIRFSASVDKELFLKFCRDPDEMISNN